jgi:hypothetical protein
MFGLGKLISPKIGVVMIRKSIEKQLGKKVPFFDIRVNLNTNKLQFIIDGIFYDHEAEELKKIIVMTVKGSLEKGSTIDLINISITDKDEILESVYYTTKKGEKQFFKEKL